MKSAVRGLLVVVVVLAALVLRAVTAGQREIALGTQALRDGDANGAIVHSRAAATWFAPGAPHVRVAYGRLLAIAREAEHRRLWETSLFAYRAIVTASASTRWVVVPHRKDAAEATAAVARIEARVAERTPTEATSTTEALERTQLDDLARDTGPSSAWVSVLAGSFAAMVLGLALLLRRGFDEAGKIELRQAIAPALVVGLGVSGYVAALLLA